MYVCTCFVYHVYILDMDYANEVDAQNNVYHIPCQTSYIYIYKMCARCTCAAQNI